MSSSTTGPRILIRDRLNKLFLRPDYAWSSAPNEAWVFDSYITAFAYCLRLRITGTEVLVGVNDRWLAVDFT